MTQHKHHETFTILVTYHVQVVLVMLLNVPIQYNTIHFTHALFIC